MTMTEGDLMSWTYPGEGEVWTNIKDGYDVEVVISGYGEILFTRLDRPDGPGRDGREFMTQFIAKFRRKTKPDPSELEQP